MIKRLTALLLALAMLFSLSACAKGVGTDITGKDYASDKPMDVFAAVEAVRELKDCAFDLRVSKLDPESGELLYTKYTASGVWYSSTKQARAQVKLEDDTLLTTLTLDGSDLYADLATAASVLAPRFQQQGETTYSGELENVGESLSADVVHIPLAEDPWTAKETGRLSQSRESLEKLYQKVKQNNSKRVRMEKNVGVLSLGLGDLQGALLDITGDLLHNQTLYQGELSQVLGEDFGAMLEQMGLEAEKLLTEKWTRFRETDEELAQLQSAGDINGWTAKLLACGDEKSGYSLDLTLNFTESTNYCLSVYPAQAEQVAAPEKSFQLQEDPRSAAVVWMDARRYVNQAPELDDGVTDAGGQELSEGEVKDYFGLEDDIWSDVSTTPVEGNSALVTAVVRTPDGASRTVPLLAEYETLKSNEGAEAVMDLHESSNGYVLEYTSADRRDLAQTVESNARMYADEFRDGWGYDTVLEPTKSVVSAKGDVAAAGMAYHEKDSGQDVTVVTCCLEVENSSSMLYLDVFVYSKSVTAQEIRAIGELMNHLGVEMPVEIIQN